MVIAIQGFKESGKDVTASMLQYLLSSPKIFHNYKLYLLLSRYNLFKRYNIIKYADKIKSMLSILLNIEISKFEDRDFKENYYIDFNTLDIIHYDKIVDTSRILSDSKFVKEIKKCSTTLVNNYYLSIRQLLQFYGTEIMRKYFGNKLWILSTLNRSEDCYIISDQRFIVENESFNSKNKSLIIHLLRKNCEKGFHSSEQELETLFNENKYNCLIENNSTKEELFNKCKLLVSNNKI